MNISYSGWLTYIVGCPDTMVDQAMANQRLVYSLSQLGRLLGSRINLWSRGGMVTNRKAYGGGHHM